MLRQFPPVVPLAEILERARLFVAEMATYGIHPAIGSRVPQYLEALEEWLEWVESKQGHRDGETIQRFIFAYQEMSLLAKIFDWLKTPPELPRWWRESFQEILDGPFFPTTDRTDHQPRDTQAELYFAGWAKHVGYRVELGDPDLHEPDVILHYENHRYAVEAKRPRSIDTVKRRVARAADQIARRGLNGGLIFLDLSIALAEAKRRILSPHAKVAEPWHIEMPDQFPKFKVRLGRHLLDLLSRWKDYIPQNLAPHVLAMSALSVETVFIGPVSPHLPSASVLACFSNRSYSDVQRQPNRLGPFLGASAFGFDLG